MRSHVFRVWIRGALTVSILLVLGAIHSAPAAEAHAVIETSSPADQAVLQKSPARVSLTFSEPVSLTAGSLRVFDAAGKRVDAGVPSRTGGSNQVAVALDPDLPSGSYAVAWRVVSADAHPVHGGFVFSVQRSGAVEDLDALIDQPSQPGYDAAGAVFRGLGYLGSFIVVGAAVFVAFVQTQRIAHRRLVGVLATVAVITVVAQILTVPVAAALATGQGMGSLFSPGVLGEVLGQGVWITLVGVALATMVGLAAVTREGTRSRILAVVSVLLVAGAFIASGHTRTTDPALPVNIVDAVHVAAGAIWVGGMAMLAWSLRSRRRAMPPGDPALAAAEVAGFSRIATVTIVAVAIAGGVLAYSQIRSLEGLFSTAYGRLVLAKIALLAVLAALGGFNHFRLVPAIERRPDRPARWGYLRRTIRFEAVALVAVLGVTAVLVNAVPSRTSLAIGAIYSTSEEIEGGSVNLVIDPARTGKSTMHVYILDSQGRPDDDEESVEVSFTQTDLQIGPLSQALQHAGPGHYLINATLFTVPGAWEVNIRVRVDEFTEKTATLTVDVTS